MQSRRSSSPQPQPSSSSSLTTMNSENQVVFFADPCSMCGTKKRRVCPLHQKFNPRKKLFAEPSPPPPNLPLFHSNSVYQTHSTESSLEDHNLKNSNTLPLKTTPEKTTTQRTGTHLSTIAEESSPESASQSQHEASLHNWVPDSNARSSSGKGKKLMKSSSREEEDFGCSSGTDDESQNTTSSSPAAHQTYHKSPLSASKPPRVPRRRQSVNNGGGDFPVRTPDSETKQGGGSSENNKESWNALKECVGMFNKLLSSGLLNNLQDRSPQEIIHQKKGIMELIDSENILKGERGVYKGSCLCSCGKKYQMILSILPE